MRWLIILSVFGSFQGPRQARPKGWSLLGQRGRSKGKGQRRKKGKRKGNGNWEVGGVGVWGRRLCYALCSVGRILRPRTLRTLKDFCHKTNKSNGILETI